MYKKILYLALLILLTICLFYPQNRVGYKEHYDDIDPSSKCQSSPIPTPPSSIPTPPLTPVEKSGPSNYNPTPLHNWVGSTFDLNNDWDFSTGDPCGSEPTLGNVCYGIWNDLISYPNNKIRINLGKKFDNKRKKAIRIKTKDKFNEGLFIIDVDHIPAENGVWPAIWLVGVGATWPEYGEIDIIEGISNQDRNATTLHTKSGCVQSFKPKLDGSANCNANNGSLGCGIDGPPGSFGTKFNKKGGVYVCEWIADKTIKVWLFDKDEFQKVRNNDTSSWKPPYASFNACPGYFKNMVLIINTTTCGQWAGNKFNGSTGNGWEACEKYVMENDLPEAYWLINSIQVYKKK